MVFKICFLMVVLAASALGFSLQSVTHIAACAVFRQNAERSSATK